MKYAFDELLFLLRRPAVRLFFRRRCLRRFVAFSPRYAFFFFAATLDFHLLHCPTRRRQRLLDYFSRPCGIGLSSHTIIRMAG